MASLRVWLKLAQRDAFQDAINGFITTIEAQSEDFVFLLREPSGDPQQAVYKITTGEVSTLTACLTHVETLVAPIKSVS